MAEVLQVVLKHSVFNKLAFNLLGVLLFRDTPHLLFSQLLLKIKLKIPDILDTLPGSLFLAAAGGYHFSLEAPALGALVPPTASEAGCRTLILKRDHLSYRMELMAPLR